tara:strand:+ start:2312 stop:2563 length:252 start_codon:yes stop_codon:yes gene_type:complete
MTKNFTVYSKDGCPYCEQIVKVLGLSELNYVEYKLDEHFDSKSFYGQFGKGATFPQVVLNGENLGGCQESIKYMQEKDICCKV